MLFLRPLGLEICDPPTSISMAAVKGLEYGIPNIASDKLDFGVWKRGNLQDFSHFPFGLLSAWGMHCCLHSKWVVPRQSCEQCLWSGGSGPQTFASRASARCGLPWAGSSSMSEPCIWSLFSALLQIFKSSPSDHVSHSGGENVEFLARPAHSLLSFCPSVMSLVPQKKETSFNQELRFLFYLKIY